MICLVLAAGYATRLYPLTEDFPKPLLPVGSRPILNWLLDDIDRQPDIGKHVIVSNHRFFHHFEAWRARQRYERPIVLLDDGSEDNEHRLGAVRDIQFAIERLDIEDDLLVVAGDNVLDFSFAGFIRFAAEKATSCVMCHVEDDLRKRQRTAIITRRAGGLITSYEEKPCCPKGDLAVPPFYFYRAADAARVSEAIADGVSTDAPGSFAAWLSQKVPMHAWQMPGRRYDIGDLDSYGRVQRILGGAREV